MCDQILLLLLAVACRKPELTYGRYLGILFACPDVNSLQAAISHLPVATCESDLHGVMHS
jgi:hypothetical protein